MSVIYKCVCVRACVLTYTYMHTWIWAPVYHGGDIVVVEA